MSEEITGRDHYIISQALTVAIPFLLLYSPSVSNTKDLMLIFKSRYYADALDGVLEKPLEKAISYMLTQLNSRDLADTANRGFQDRLVAEYLDEVETFLPRSISEAWKKTEIVG